MFEQKNFNFEFSVAEDEPGTITGYGSVFGNVDSWGDIVEKGAFIKSLGNRVIPVLWQHNTDEPIGVWTEITEDDYGLKMKGRLLIDDVQKAKEAYALIKSGAINGLSIGYTVKDYSLNKTENQRLLKDIELYEVSLVTFPANEKAIVTSVKSELTIRDAERALTDAGFSQKRAKSILAKGFKSAIDRDDQTEQCDAEIKTLESIRRLLDIF